MFAIGKAFEKKNREDIALLWYARAIGAKPSYGRARQSVAEICERKGQIDLADEYFLSIPQANPKWRMGRFALAQYLWRQERKEDALKEFRTAWSAMRPWEQGVVENTEAGRQMKMLAFPFDILS
jgi:tetratricopeptide (TPR) repeat protein